MVELNFCGKESSNELPWGFVLVEIHNYPFEILFNFASKLIQNGIIR